MPPRLEELEARVLLSWSPHLLADLNPQPASSDPNDFLTIGAITYFAADDGVHGRELWRTDGTAAGTFMVKDIDHGLGYPRDLFKVNGNFLFRAGPFVNQVWASDGTTDGTRLVKEFNPAHPQRAHPGDFTLLGRTALFVSTDVDNGDNIWRTDGTPTGTVSLTHLYLYSGLTVVGDTAFFTAGDGTHGVELWKTDGTIAGTVLVKDINPGPGSSDPVDLTAVGNLLLFVANDGVHGRELWRSDGTDAGTFMARDINPGPRSAFPLPYEGFDYPFTVAGKQAFFIANGTEGKKLWVSDGTTQGTHIVVGAAPGSSPQFADSITPSGSVIYYLPDNTAGPELWRSDGTPAGTYSVKQLNPAVASSPFIGVTTWNGLFYFLADDGTHHGELWVTDGTSSGTSMLQDFTNFTFPCRADPVTLGSTLYFFLIDRTGVSQFWRTDGTPPGTALVADVNGWALTVANGQMLFAGTDAQHGTQLWHSDGTTSGTTLLKDINPGTLGSLDPNKAQFVSFGGSTYFAIDDPPSGAQLWKTDGTSTGTQLVAQVEPWLGRYSVMPHNFTVVGNTLFFVADDLNGDQLWKSNGTTAGTVIVTSSGSGGPNGLLDLVAFKGSLYFSVITNTDSSELWTSDGTAAGTVKLASFARGNNITSSLVVANGLLFFVTGNTELWESDGTSAGTTLLQTLATQNPAAVGEAPSLFGLNGELYYSSNADGQGWQLWKTDGTTAGTTLVKVLTPGGDAFPTDFVNVSGLLYFTAFDGSGGTGLWRSDGTGPGTQMILDVPSPGGIDQLTNVNGRLFFEAVRGQELWQSDGTAQGTSKVVDIGTGRSGFTNLTAFEGHLFFVANNGNDGAYLPNLWVSDGTAAGTNMVGGIRLEGTASPAALTAIGNALYFVADDGIHGMEPWIFAQTTTAAARSPVPTDLAAAYFVRPTLNLVAPEQQVSLGPTTTAVPAQQTQSHRVWVELTASSATAGAPRLSSRHIDALFRSAWGRDSLWELPA